MQTRLRESAVFSWRDPEECEVSREHIDLDRVPLPLAGGFIDALWGQLDRFENPALSID
jgi:hypothetical protein